MPPCLIVFIDALPQNHLDRAPFLSGMRWTRSLRPGFGYSVNIKSELFAGLSPDDLGVLSEWKVSEDGWYGKWAPLWTVLSPLSHAPFLDRLAHRGLTRLLGRPFKDIPFRFLRHFDVTLSCAYEDDYPHPSLFNGDAPPRRFLYSRHRPGPDRDRLVFEEADRFLQAGEPSSVFVPFCGLDETLHAAGIGTESFAAKIREIDGYAERMAGTFLSRQPDGSVVVLSDHGGANVTGEVRLDLESAAGPATPSTYLYFIDSTMLRVWIRSETVRPRIVEYLEAFDGGRILTQDERERFNVASKGLADILFLLDEGVLFSPSFFGRMKVTGMHGYDPDLPNQQGVLCCNFEPGEPAPTRALEIHRFLQGRIGQV